MKCMEVLLRNQYLGNAFGNPSPLAWHLNERIVTQKGVLRLAMCKTSATHEGL